MSCPYFFPQEPLPEGSRATPARIPLGLLYEGECHADPQKTDVSTAADCCNFGYGHGRCDHFPRQADADAVRFTMSTSRELTWILEKDFAPVKHGNFSAANAIVRRQAEVFLENYDRNIVRPSGS
jgi:hypothetical protein